MAGRRTNYQIQKDYEKLKKAAKTARSFKELGEMVGLSYGQIKTTLSLHPIVEKRIRKQLEENANQSFLKEKDEKVQKLENTNLVKSEEKREEKKEEKREEISQSDFDFLEPGKNYVLDTSMCGVKKIEELIGNITCRGSKIIITSIVNNELERLQNKADIVTAIKARKILRLAATNTDKFEFAFVKKEGVPDDCIIDYCIAHKNKVILLTADKHMAIDARTKGIKSIYFPVSDSFNDVEVIEEIEKESKIEKTTIDIARFRSTGLSIDAAEFKKRNQFIMVMNGKKKYLKGPLQLDVDYEVLVARREWEKIVFTHYKMIRKTAANHAIIIYSEEGLANDVLQNMFYEDFNLMAKKYFNLQ